MTTLTDQRTKDEDCLKQLAEMIVRGEAKIPWDLSDLDLQFLLSEVHSRRRQLLVTFFARAITRWVIAREHE